MLAHIALSSVQQLAHAACQPEFHTVGCDGSLSALCRSEPGGRRHAALKDFRLERVLNESAASKMMTVLGECVPLHYIVQPWYMCMALGLRVLLHCMVRQRVHVRGTSQRLNTVSQRLHTATRCDCAAAFVHLARTCNQPPCQAASWASLIHPGSVQVHRAIRQSDCHSCTTPLPLGPCGMQRDADWSAAAGADGQRCVFQGAPARAARTASIQCKQLTVPEAVVCTHRRFSWRPATREHASSAVSHRNVERQIILSCSSRACQAMSTA